MRQVSQVAITHHHHTFVIVQLFVLQYGAYFHN